MTSASPSGHVNPAHQAEGKGVEPSSPLTENALAGRPSKPIAGYLPYRFSVDPPGIEPGSPPRQGGVVPLDHEPVFFSGPDGSRTRHTDLARVSRLLGTCQPKMSRGPSGNRTRSSSLPRRCAAETPTDQFPSDPGWSRTSTLLAVAQASLPLDHGISSGRSGSRTRSSPRFELGRFACLRTAPFL